jgi:hypothetical protein
LIVSVVAIAPSIQPRRARRMAHLEPD